MTAETINCMAIMTLALMLFCLAKVHKKIHFNYKDVDFEDLDQDTLKYERAVLQNLDEQERVARIISIGENQRVKNIAKHPLCTASMRRRIEGFYNPYTQSYFMRYSDLQDFETELNKIIECKREKNFN